jgi:hypothetical protein
MRQVNVSQFATLARSLRSQVADVLKARAFAVSEQQRVDAYVRPIFDGFTFTISGDVDPRHAGQRITKPRDLYLSSDGELCQQFYDACDAAHRAHGFTGPHGYCPALVAETDAMRAERALLEKAGAFFGVDFASNLFGDDRVRCLSLLIGASKVGR